MAAAGCGSRAMETPLPRRPETSVRPGSAWLVLSEQPTAWQLAGAACIMTGILLARAQVTPSPVAGTPD